MSRTNSHMPSKFLRDKKNNLLVSHEEFERHSNVKNKIMAKKTRRKIRYSAIDDEDVNLINAISEYKSMSYLAKDRNW